MPFLAQTNSMPKSKDSDATAATRQDAACTWGANDLGGQFSAAPTR